VPWDSRDRVLKKGKSGRFSFLYTGYFGRKRSKSRFTKYDSCSLPLRSPSDKGNTTVTEDFRKKIFAEMISH
jgi:hypothetical protein